MGEIENALGCIFPTKVNERSSNNADTLLGHRVVFQPRAVSFKGTVKWSGTINGGIAAYGIATDEVDMGTNGKFNGYQLFNCAEGCGVLIRQSENIFEIDGYYGCVKGKRFADLKERGEADERERYRENDVVIVKCADSELVGVVKAVGYLGDILCYGISFKGKEEEFVYVANDIWGKFFDDDGLINKDFQGNSSVLSRDSVYPQKIGDRVDHHGIRGTLKWKGEIESYKCIAIDPDNAQLAADFKKLFDNEDAYWAVICLEKFNENKSSVVAGKNHMYEIPRNYREIQNPQNEGFHTYFRIKAFVKVASERGDGVVENYVCDERNNFRYGIKLDDKEELIYVTPDHVKCATPMDFRNAFYQINDPKEFGIVTKLEINDFVRVKPNKENKLKENCYGNIVWMGFDGDCTFRVLLHLDNMSEEAQGGTYFGQKLADIEDKRGLLVLPNCIETFRDTERLSCISKDYSHSEFLDKYLIHVVRPVNDPSVEQQLFKDIMRMKKTSILKSLIATMNPPINLDLHQDLLPFLIHEKHYDIVKLVISNCNTKSDNFNRIALEVANTALLINDGEMLDLAIKKCTNPNVLLKNGETFLTNCFKTNVTQKLIIKIINTGSFTLNIPNELFETPLMLACERAMASVVKLILSKCPLTSTEKKSALRIAYKNRGKYSQQKEYLDNVMKIFLMLNDAETVDKLQCNICMDRRVNVVFDCGHVSCDICSQKLVRCHFCNRDTGSIRKLYL